MDQVQILRQDVDELTRQLNEMRGLSEKTTAVGAQSSIDFTPIPAGTPVPPASNQIRNGDGSHSVNTYKDTVAAPGTDKVLECAYWFAHAGPPAAADVLDVTTDAETSSVNKALKAVGHSNYDASYPDWSVPAGVMRMTGTRSLDAPFPNNSIYPGRPMYLGAIIAFRNSTIVATDDCHLAAMLYNNNTHDFIKSNVAFHLSGAVRGTPAAVTERRYKVLAETDRGYSFLSDEYVEVNAPTNASFSSSVDVALSWPMIEGVLRYRVFRHNIVAATYDELREITSGTNTYGDNNSILRPGVAGYPTATDSLVKSYVATLAGDLTTLPVDGVALKWDSVFLNIPVPKDLADAGSGFQVLRLALTKALDRQMVDAVSTAASTSISSATGAFTTLDTGRTATLFAPNGTVLHGPEVITFVDATHVTFATNVATSNNPCTLYIVGGGDHGLLIDMVHIGYISRAAYAPFFEDLNRALPSTAVPNSSSQGGLGPPGDTGDPGDGGIGGCVTMDTPIVMLFGNSFLTRAFQLVSRGEMLRSGNLVPNVVHDIKISETDNLTILRTANGIELQCSPGQRVFRSFIDERGMAVSRLKINDYVLTCHAGRDECSKIIELNATGRRAKVGTFALAPRNKFVAGKKVLRWWQWMERLKQRRYPSGIYCHNRKRDDIFPA